ncbi:EcsC family protein [Aquibacillus koreensis]|uniref:EcsC family protein n=1 Tax=Aquibacillus koreensis TaxID=279446 RepID=A0A9X4AJA6_9BACI|nr:EcsC family protein [Aquibacillus koreensis]MCT2535572.1 EcsC family protein [Aquibacillus koreensis]MDC3420143.1 EcsC family protein [Aquibacillus koreensis]
MRKEAERYSRSVRKKSSVIQRTSKKVQTKVNHMIPDKVHSVVTESIKRMIQLALTSSEYIRPVKVDRAWNFEEREKQVKIRLVQAKKTAMIEGAGTGAGGIWLGLADFPLLLSIKMKFLFDAAQLYGFDVTKYEERMYLLHVFLLAFSSDDHRKEVLQVLMDWDQQKEYYAEIDWKTLQLEYRDSLDFVKMFQLIPGFGAIVGAVANRKLLEQLGEASMNMYRLRMLKE